MINFTRVCVGLLVLILSGCVSVQMAHVDDDNKAKLFSAPPAGKATLYIYRNEYFGNTITKVILVNGKSIGESAGHTYFRLDLLPGRYFISNPSNDYMSGGKNIQISLERGKTYFVWQEIKTGGPGWFHLVDEQTGRDGVRECELAALQIDIVDLMPSGAQMSEASEPQEDLNSSTSKKLRELKSLRKDEIITEEEYQKKRQQLLEKL